MVDKQKIVTLTQLALYDKHNGPVDRMANDYFRHDYIYRKNMSTRFAVGFGSVLILVVYWLGAIFINEVNAFGLTLADFTESIIFVLAMLALYSLIGIIQGTREYYMVQKRLQQYQQHLRTLEKLEKQTKPEERI